MASSLRELSFTLDNRFRQSHSDAGRTTLAMSAGLTAWGLAFSHLGPSLGALAVVTGLALSLLAMRYASRTVALAVSVFALGFYLQAAGVAP